MYNKPKFTFEHPTLSIPYKFLNSHSFQGNGKLKGSHEGEGLKLALGG